MGAPLKLPTKLKDTLEKVRKLDNRSNSDLLIEFYEYSLAPFVLMVKLNYATISLDS